MEKQTNKNHDVTRRTAASRLARQAAPKLATVAGTALMTVAGVPVHAGPQGGQVVGGDGYINRVGGHTTRIMQQSHRMSIRWDSFNVAANERVVFDQPTAQSSVLNRIMDQNPSQIFGAIDANGQVFLINPHGIVFGETAQVKLGALVASTLDLSTDDFMRGNYDLKALADRNGGLIVNRGLIEAATGGSVTLVGGAVANEGVIVADYGTVNLAAGRSATIDFDGDGLMLFEVDDEILHAPDGVEDAVANSGTIQADGGRVLLSAQTARGVFDNVVNNSGYVRANRVENVGGEIRLSGSGGVVRNSGRLEARGARGGDITITGDTVGLVGNAVVDASGLDAGGRVRIGGGQQGLDASIDNAEFVYVGQDTRVSADALYDGRGGRVIVYADEAALVYGDLSARGGAEGGDGGFVETSGKGYLQVIGAPQIGAERGQGGTWLVDPFNLNIVANAAMTNVAFDNSFPGFMSSYTSNGAGSEIGVDDIFAGLQMGNVRLVTGVGGPADGGTITWTTGAVLDTNGLGAAGPLLQLEALRDIIFQTGSGIFDSDTGIVADGIDLTLDAARNIDIQNGSTVDIGGGTFTGLIGDGTNAGSFILGPTATFASGAASVTGSDGNDTFTINRPYTGDLVGGAGDDTFTINADVTGSLQGEGDNDTFDINFTATVTDATPVVGGTGADILDLQDYTDDVSMALASANADGFAGTSTGLVTGGFSGIRTVRGRAAGTNDSLTGANGNANWVLDGTPTYELVAASQVLNFAGFENLTGNDGVDDVAILNGASVNINVDGAGGNDTFRRDVNVVIAGVDGGDGVDSLTGPNQVVQWVVNQPGGGLLSGTDGVGNVSALSFTNFETLIGREANDTFILTGGGSVTGSLIGGGGAGVDLVSSAGANTWTLTGPAAGNIDGIVFTLMESLLGGNGIDQFVINGDFGGTIDGGDNDDVFDINAVFGGTLIGGAGNDTFDINVAHTGSISGLAGNDVFEIGAAVSGQLIGGDGNDQFLVEDGGSVAGGAAVGIDGAGGSDTLSYAGLSAAVTATLTASGANGFTGTANGLSGTPGGFANINTLIGSAQVDTLNGQPASASWALDATPTYSVGANTLNFSAFESLVGSVSVDTVTIQAGADATITSVSGGGGNDIFNLNASFANQVLGGGGNDRFNLSAGAIIGTLAGGGGTDTLVGPNADATWLVNAANEGNVTIGVDVQSFTEMETLQGGTGVDAFTINANLGGSVLAGANTDSITVGAGVAVTGGLDAGDGDDQLELGDGASASNIAGGTGNDTLTAQGDNDWAIDGAGSGSINTASYSGIEALVGGAGADAFTVSASASGVSIDGGGGVNTVLSGTTGTNAWTIDGLRSGTVNGIGFDNIDQATGGSGVDNFALNASFAGGVDGGAGDDSFTLAAGAIVGTLAGGAGIDTLTGPNLDATWLVDAANAGNVTIGVDVQAFTAIESLVGGSATDAMNINADLGGSVTSGGGNDGIVVAAGATIAGAVDAGDGDDQVQLGATASVGSIAAGTGADTLSADGNNAWVVNDAMAGTLNGADYTGVESLVGLAGNDAFTVESTASGITIDGGAGTNSLTSGGAGQNTWTIDGNRMGTVNTIAFDNIDALSGGDGIDAFTINSNFAGTIAAGAGDDTFTLAIAAVIGGLDGGSGFDTLTGTDGDATWNVTADNAGTLTIAGSTVNFAAVESLVSGAGNDTLTAAANLDGGFTGGDGNDTVTLGDNVSFATGVDAGAGNDIVTLGAGASASGSGILAGTGDDSVTLGDAATASTIQGGDGSDTLIGLGDNTWQLTGSNSGNLDGTTFTFVENLTGSDGVDTANILQFASIGLTGTFNTAGGDDVITVVYAGTADRNLTIDTGDGNDTLTLTGGAAGGTASYDLGAGSVTHGVSGRTQILTVAGAELINDSMTATSVNVAAGSGDATITLGDTTIGADAAASVGVAGGPTLALTNKTNIAVDGGDGNDTINVAGAFVLPGEINLVAETITAGAAGMVGGTVLRIVGAAMVGTDLQALATAVDQLAVTGLSGNAFIADSDAIELLESSTTADLTLTAGGDITQSGTLSVDGTGRFSAAGAAITLNDGGNDFGTVEIADAAVAEVRDSNDLVLGASTVAGALDVTADAGLTLAGAISAASALLEATTGALTQTGGGVTAASMTASAANGIDLGGANALSALTASVTGAGDLGVNNDSAALSIDAATVTSGNVSITNSGALTVAGNVGGSGSAITLNAGGAIGGGGSISGASLATMSVGGTNLTAQNDVASYSAMNSGSGDIVFIGSADMLTLGGVSQSGGGNVDITGTGGMTVDGAVTVGGSGNLVLSTGASGTFVQNAAVSTSGGSIAVNAGTGIVMAGDAGASSANGNIGYCTANGDIVIADLNAGTGDVLVKIASTGGAGDINVADFNVVITGTNVTLDAGGPLGQIGTASQPVTIDAPAGNAGLIVYRDAGVVEKRNLNNTAENEFEVGSVNDSLVAAAQQGFAAGQSAGLLSVGYVDPLIFEPVSLIQVIDTGVLLPCDQVEDEPARCQ